MLVKLITGSSRSGSDNVEVGLVEDVGVDIVDVDGVRLEYEESAAYGRRYQRL